MLCTRCHHDIHRQGWDIRVHANHVDFIPPPQINPQRKPHPGGLTTITAGECHADGDNIEPEAPAPKENSAPREPEQEQKVAAAPRRR